MGKLLNGRLLEDLMLSDALASGAFDQVPCQHTGEFDKKKIKMSWKCPGVDGKFWNWLVHNITETRFTSLMKFVRFEWKKKLFQTVFPWILKLFVKVFVFSYLTVFKQGIFIM